MEVKYDEKDLALILLCLLPPSYSNFRDTILYSYNTISMEDVYDALSSYEKMKTLVVGTESKAKVLLLEEGVKIGIPIGIQGADRNLQIRIKLIIIARRRDI